MAVDGLIIPRSYNDYINKTDPVALSQALQQNGVLSDTVQAGDTKAVQSEAVKTAIDTAVATKQDILTFDDAPTDGSTNPVKSDGIYDAIKALLPIGLVFPFAGSTVPANFLECDGSAVSRTTYADLFTVIGTTYGTGDGSTTFNLPDYREVALVGAGQNSTDSIATHDVYTVGQFKDDQIQTHSHIIQVGKNANLGAIDAGIQWSQSHYFNVDVGNHSSTSSINLDGTTIESARTGSVTHGKSKAVKYIIKAL